MHSISMHLLSLQIITIKQAGTCCDCLDSCMRLQQHTEATRQFAQDPGGRLYQTHMHSVAMSVQLSTIPSLEI